MLTDTVTLQNCSEPNLMVLKLVFYLYIQALEGSLELLIFGFDRNSRNANVRVCWTNLSSTLKLHHTRKVLKPIKK